MSSLQTPASLFPGAISELLIISYSIAGNGISPYVNSGLSLAPTIHNGVAIGMVSGPAFTSVTIDPVTNMSGFDASRFSFTANQIQVDWAGLPFNTSTIVKLDVNQSPVPIPATLLLLSPGIAALAAVRRKLNR